MSISERLAIGTRIGNYRIERELTTGALYAACHVVLPRRALLKVAPATGAVQVLREACILEALRHAGLPAVYESGLLADGRPWFAVETIEGQRLTDVVARAALKPGEVAALIRDVAAVLEHAHRRGVVHGGLRSDRIVLTGRGRGFPLCITDWSDARTYDAQPTIPHVPTPSARAYLAPEVLRGDAIDDRADVYALGVVAYQALTGALPVSGAYVAVRVRCPRAPRELANAIDQMLAHDRFDRPSSAEVMGDIAWVTDAARATDTMRDLPALHEIQLTELDAINESPADELEARVTAVAVPIARIRKPRWTPQALVTCDPAGVVSGEIDDVDAPTIRPS